MKIRAKTTFVGTFNMKKDEIKECDDRRVVNDLKKLGLVEDVPEETRLGKPETAPQATVTNKIGNIYCGFPFASGIENAVNASRLHAGFATNTPITAPRIIKINR